jgi:hypothetical protein
MGGGNKAKERHSDELKVGEDGMSRGAALAKERLPCGLKELVQMTQISRIVDFDMHI